MLVTMLHTIIPNQVVTTPRLSGGDQALQSLYDYLSHADKGKAGGGQALQPLYDYLSLMQTRNQSSCSVPHTLIVSLSVGLYSRGIHLKVLTKTASGD